MLKSRENHLFRAKVHLAIDGDGVICDDRLTGGGNPSFREGFHVDLALKLIPCNQTSLKLVESVGIDRTISP